MYDFLLFENYHLATHHIYDLVLIARMMRSQGLRVAIFDIYHEIKDDHMDGIPVIHWNSNNAVPDDTWMQRKHSALETLKQSFKYRIQTHYYFKELVGVISDKASAFYCGSYHNGMSTILFSIKKPCYYWGLRSERMKFSMRKLLPSPISGLHILLERKRFLKNPFQRLFVSNQLIMDEHERLGVPRSRMVIREERVVEEWSDANLASLDNSVSFLVIGQLRKEKHLPTTIKAFKKANITDSTLKLIGRSSPEYEVVINEAMGGDERITRVNKYLDYDDFFRFFSESHFVLFADEKGPSCITNGTMMEALIHHRPVICPDYDPYKYYIDHYGVGMMYKAGDVDSFADALIKAVSFDVAHFESKIDAFLETITFERVSKKLVIELKTQIKFSK